jgi:hypothetical protein
MTETKLAFLFFFKKKVYRPEHVSFVSTIAYGNLTANEELHTP